MDYSKQEILIKQSQVNERINIVGAGAVGGWVAYILLKMGFTNVHIYDFDVVEEHNIPNQIYRESQVGQLKVRSLMAIYRDSFTDTEERLKIHTDIITQENANRLTGIVINCVDTMAARKYIYELSYKYGNARILIEDRLSVYGGYIYTLNENTTSEQKEDYEETFYADEDAEVSACGISQTALPAAMNVATVIVMQLISLIRGEDTKYKIMYTIPDMYAIIE